MSETTGGFYGLGEDQIKSFKEKMKEIREQMSEMTATHDTPLYRYTIETNEIIPIGWLCPRCGAVNAPDVKQCECEPEDNRHYTLGPSETK